MNDFANLHQNTEKINDKLLADSFSILGPTLDLYQAEEIVEEGRDETFDIFSQSLSETLCHNFDHPSGQSLNTDASFSGSSQIIPINAQDEKYSCKSKIGCFPMFNKVWPDQLDILAGPLLEDDDDTCNNCDISCQHSSNSEGLNLTSDSEQTLFLNRPVTTKIGTDAKMFYTDSINCKNRKNGEIKFGNVIRISKDEDTGEEIDVVTIDEDSSISNINLGNQQCHEASHNLSKACTNLAIEACDVDSQGSNIQSSGSQTDIMNNISNAALEAPDLDSLLEQFEATQDCIHSKRETTSIQENRVVEPAITLELTPKGSSTTSLIKKIKSSIVPSRSTIMISHETVLKSTSPNRLKIDDNTQLCNYVISKRCAIPISRTLKDLTMNNSDGSSTINTSDDHDYCSPLPLSGNSPYYNKIPEYLTELKPRKNTGHNKLLRMALSRKDKVDNKNNQEIQNVKNAEDSIQKFPSDIQYKINDTVLPNFQNTRVVSSPLSPTVSNLLDDESLSSISSGISEKSTNPRCQSLDIVNTKESKPSELMSASELSELESASVSNSVDFQYNFQHIQYSKHNSNSISSSPSHSPPPKWFSLKRSRSRSPPLGEHLNKLSRGRNSHRHNFTMWEHHKEKLKQIEERRVLYVGNIHEGITRADLRERFGKFGPIHEVSIHIRDFNDNYAFVTFCNRNDAYMAMEHGNDNPNLPKFELSFGGRRQFCKVKYADLDSQYDTNERRDFRRNCNDLDFDSLLKDVKAQFKSRHRSPQS